MFKKRNKSTLEEKQKLAAQQLIPIKAIDKGLILTPDNRLVQILKISALNLELMSKTELNLLLEEYEAFLKSFTFPFQQEIVSEPVDLKRYIRQQEEFLEQTKNFHRRSLMKSYIEYTKTMETSRQIMRRQRYIIFDEKISGSTKKEYEEAVHDIEEKKEHVESGLKEMDLSVEPVTNTEIVRFFHIFFNYEGALHQSINPDQLLPITVGKSIEESELELPDVFKERKENCRAVYEGSPLFTEKISDEHPLMKRAAGEPIVIDEKTFPKVRIGGEEA